MASQEKMLSIYVKMLTKERELTEKFKEQMEAIRVDRGRAATMLIKSGVVEEVPEIICSDDPWVAWQIGERNDAYAIGLYRVLRDSVAAGNRCAKDAEAESKMFMEKIGGWLLNSLNKSGHKSVNCGAAGKAYKQTKTRVNATDWTKFIKWAADNGAEDAVQKRVNASFVNSYEEENDELPPFIDVFRELEVRVTK